MEIFSIQYSCAVGRMHELHELVCRRVDLGHFSLVRANVQANNKVLMNDCNAIFVDAASPS